MAKKLRQIISNPTIKGNIGKVPTDTTSDDMKDMWEAEDLVSNFHKSIHRWRFKRDECGPACYSLMDYAEKKGTKLDRIQGTFRTDIPVHAKNDFTPSMKSEFKKTGMDFNNPEHRKNFISKSKYADEWKNAPHYWTKDEQGNIHDPSGHDQFVRSGLSKDLNKNRYREKLHENILDYMWESEDDQYLYHATYQPRMKSIMKSGLHGNTRHRNWEDSGKGKVYLANSAEGARSYAETAEDEKIPDHYFDKIKVLKIHKKHLDPSHLHQDKNVYDSNDTFEYHKPIPPHHIEIHENILDEISHAGIQAMRKMISDTTTPHHEREAAKRVLDKHGLPHTERPSFASHFYGGDEDEFGFRRSKPKAKTYTAKPRAEKKFNTESVKNYHRMATSSMNFKKQGETQPDDTHEHYEHHYKDNRGHKVEFHSYDNETVHHWYHVTPDYVATKGYGFENLSKHLWGTHRS